jgi:hypothetical protein
MDAPVFSFEDLTIFPRHFSIGGTSYPFESVRRLKGGGSKSTINFVPMEKSSNLHIELMDGSTFSYSEDSKFLKGKRHKEIQTTFGILKKATAKPRLENLAARIKQNRKVELVAPISMDFGKFIGDVEIDQVILHCNGTVESKGLIVDLKVAATSGTLWLGTESHSFGYSRQSFNPAEVVVSEHKAGRRPHKESIQFYPIDEDVDVTHTILRWFSEAENSLC